MFKQICYPEPGAEAGSRNRSKLNRLHNTVEEETFYRIHRIILPRSGCTSLTCCISLVSKIFLLRKWDKELGTGIWNIWKCSNLSTGTYRLKQNQIKRMDYYFRYVPTSCGSAPYILYIYSRSGSLKHRIYPCINVKRIHYIDVFRYSLLVGQQFCSVLLYR